MAIAGDAGAEDAHDRTLGTSREGAVLAARAVSSPDTVAIEVDGEDVLSYAAWEHRSNAVATGLSARGIRSGDPVGLLFDTLHWTDFAVAHAGVLKAGAAPALFSPGASAPDLARALLRSGATGLLCAPGLAPAAAPGWVAELSQVVEGHDGSAPHPVRSQARPDLAYPPTPLAPPEPWSSGGRAGTGPELDGWLVHAWAPGSPAGQWVIGRVRAGSRVAAVTLAAFDPDRFCALIGERRATGCGLTPALAAALVASGATRRQDVSSVTRVVLSGTPGPGLMAVLREAFAHAEVTGMDGRGSWTAPAPAAGDVFAPPAACDAPVAVSQEGMLWHECFTPGSFNLPCLVRRYRGRLDADAFGWAMSELARRHQPLRSTFAVVDGEPRQVVEDRSPPLAVVDLGRLAAEDRDAEVARVLADATTRPFDLATGPLFDPSLLRLGPDDHLLVVRLHHTVFDDWSVDVFRRELSALYTARRAGEPSPLVEPHTGFADFCRRQRARLAGEQGAAQRSWWRRELDGAPLSVQLPLGDGDGDGDGDGSGEGMGGAPGEPLRVDLPPALAAALQRLAPTLRATPFMTVLAAFSVLLGRVTGQDDLVIATVVAHRNRSDVEPLIGCFTKKVPLRLRLHGDPTFAELVARTRASLLGSLSNQDVAFDAALQEGLGRAAADHGVVPQVAVVFQGETPQQVKVALAGLSAGPYEVQGDARRERHFTQGPGDPPSGDGSDRPPVWGDGIYIGSFLILSLLETAGGMSLVARGVFDRPAARRLLEDFQSLLAEVVADPSRPVSTLGPASGEPAAPGDVVRLRGFRASGPRLEAALGRCPGVAEVAVAVRDDDGGDSRLVAYVVARPDRPPTLGALRRALWETLPGAPWPSQMIAVERLARMPDGRPDIDSLPGPGPDGPGGQADPGSVEALLTAMWGEIGGRRMTPDTNYWQDFSFLQVLAEAREAGIALPDEQVARCRTPETLAAALTAGPTRT